MEPGSLAPTWWTLDADGQHVGPYTAKDVAGYVAAGQMPKEALIWAEGQPEWQPIEAVPDIQAAAETQISSTTGGYTIAARANGAGTAARPSAIAAAAAAAPSTSATGQDDEMAAFQAELADIDPDAAAALNPATTAGRTSTPPPEDQRFVDDDGTVYFWDPHLKKFVEEGTTTATMPAYNPEDMTFVPEEEKIPALPRPAEGEEQADGQAEDEDAQAMLPKGDSAEGSQADAGQAGPSGSAAAGRRGSKSETTASDVIAKHKRAREAEKKAAWFDLKVNTSVYITGLPEDATEAEVAEVFTKCGVIKEGDDRKPRIKMYRDKVLGVAKGDGLVTYLKEPSVDLACRILDGAQFRPGIGAAMTVQPAKFEMHGEEYKPRKKAANKRQKKAAAQAEERALGWGGFDDKLKPAEVTVILLHMFDPAELQGAAGEEKELEADVRTECERIGPVDKVRVFTHNPLGVISVRFKTAEAANECIQKMDGRFFGGRQLQASLWDGVTNYVVKKQETAQDEAVRLEAFAKSIEGSD